MHTPDTGSKTLFCRRVRCTPPGYLGELSFVRCHDVHGLVGPESARTPKPHVGLRMATEHRVVRVWMLLCDGTLGAMSKWHVGVEVGSGVMAWRFHKFGQSF